MHLVGERSDLGGLFGIKGAEVFTLEKDVLSLLAARPVFIVSPSRRALYFSTSCCSAASSASTVRMGSFTCFAA